jgi:hypothetical protein
MVMLDETVDMIKDAPGLVAYRKPMRRPAGFSPGGVKSVTGTPSQVIACGWNRRLSGAVVALKKAALYTINRPSSSIQA